MERFEGDKTAVESGEKFTVQEWRYLTRDWSPVCVILAKLATEKGFEERQEIVADITEASLFGPLSSDPEYSRFIADVLALSDEALERLNKALLLNELGRQE